MAEAAGVAEEVAGGEGWGAAAAEGGSGGGGGGDGGGGGGDGGGGGEGGGNGEALLPQLLLQAGCWPSTVASRRAVRIVTTTSTTRPLGWRIIAWTEFMLLREIPDVAQAAD